jgi:hypothetical protein
VTISQLVDRERHSLRRLHVIAGVVIALALTASIVALATVGLGGARWMTLPRATPFAVWVAVIAANVGAWALTRYVLARETSVDEIAAALEREQSLRAGSVRGTMEVANTGSLGQKAAADLTSRLGAVGDTLVPDARGRARRRVTRLALTAAVAVVALGALAPAFGDGLRAVIRPVDAWRGTLLPAITFEHLPTAVVRGEALTLRMMAPGRRQVMLDRRATGEGWHTDRLQPGPDGRVAVDVGPMSGDLYLVASDGRSATDTLVVRVADRPFLGGIAMHATYPAYLGRAAEGLPMGEPARVPAGTVMEISGRASTELHEISLVSELADASRVPLTPSGHAFRGRLVPRASGAWRWSASGVAGVVSDVPPPVEIEVIPDSLPRVEIVTPARDTLVAPGAQVPLRLAAMDDHGLASVDVVSWSTRDARDGQRATVNVARQPGAIWGSAIVLDVGQRGLVAGDVLHIRVAATDNSPWSQRGESRELLVRVATAEQQRDMARATGDSAVAAAEAAVRAQKALERRAAEAGQERAANADGKGGDRMSFEAAQKAKAVAQDQKALADQVKQLAEVAKALEQQLREAGALDTSLAKQLQEAQAMLRDALTPEMLQQMQKLEQSAQDLSREDAQQSLRDLREQQRRLREQLEKSAEMLKRAAMEGSMQTLTDEAKDLANRQRKLADSSATMPEPRRDQAAKELADRTDRLGKQMEKLEERLENAKAATGAAKTQEARDHAESAEQKLRGDQAKPAGEPKAGGEQKAGADAKAGAGGEQKQGAGGEARPGGSGEKAGQAARDAAEQMDQAASAMKAARDGQVQEWKKELTSALDQSIQELLQMSREESALQQQVRSGAAKSEDARGQQSAIKQGLDAASQRLQREAQKSTLLSGRSQRAVADAQQKVDQATQSASDPRSGSQSAQAMNEAAEALNKAAASLARDRERANTASSASGFAEMIQQMQEMAGKQGSINSQAQSIMPQPGSSMSGAAQAQARALARQQRQVADKLDELGDGAGGDKAAKMAQEARQLAEALEGSRIDATTLARQQQLFRKMLDAGRSLEKEDREESDRREARAAVDPKTLTPSAAPVKGKDAQRFREPTWDELRGLSADERRLILDYFRKLNGPPGGRGG